MLAVAMLLLAQEQPALPPGRPQPPVRFLTFNIRYGTAPDGENSWERRRDLVARVLEEQRPEVAAIQEALDFQLDFLLERFPRYRASGAHRDGGRKGEFTGLLVDRQRLDLEQEGQFWLSDTPDQPGSVGWDAALPRLCSWAVLRHRLTGDRIAVLATHLDHEGEKARLESARLIVRKLDGFGGLPLVVLGDLNAGEDAPPLRELRAAGLRDSLRELHPDASGAGTFHGFSGAARGPRIDHVLCSERWLVHEARILSESYDGRFPSDHFPVLAVLTLRQVPEPPGPGPAPR